MKLKNKLLLGSLTAVLLAVMSFSAWKIWVIRSEYHAGEAAYEDISHMISLPQKAAVPQPPATSESGGAETQPDEDDTIWPEVDFVVLRETNPDIVAWIYIEGTKINYPIVQGEDNRYYLKHLFSGEWNGSGCIFLDFRNDASFADRHSIIYGHHMFLTGFVFLAGIITLYPVTLIEVVTGEVFIKLSTVPEIVLLLLCLIASSYEIGLILNRAGSVIIEPVLIKTKFLRFSENYSLYAEASKKTPMLNTISREYALSRTSIVEFLVLAIWSTCIGKWLLSVCYLAVAIVFLFSCKKHSAKIATVVEIFRKTHKSTQQ